MPDDNGKPDGEKPQGDQGHEGQGEKPLDFDGWLGAQDETVKGLIDTHLKGLKSALDAERTQRRDYEKQLRDAAAKLEKGSDAQKQLEEMAKRSEEDGKRADFFAAAHRAGVTNLQLAWVAAKQDQIFDRKGDVDLEALKEAYPELFTAPATTKTPTGNAGAGTGNVPAKNDMNALIRRAAGRG